MAVDATAAPVVAAYQRSSEALRLRLLAFVAATWAALENYRDTDIDAFVATVVPVTEAAQVQAGALTDAYLAAVETALLGDTVAPVGVGARVVSTEALRGVPATEVWRRPALEVWRSLDAGQDLTASVTHGLNRATEIADTNLQLARTHTAQAVLSGKRNVVGYRRVPRGAKACALCRTAATQRYRKGDLQPIHTHCFCGVLPIYGSRDPGRVITRDEAAEAARETELAVHTHGEIGPVLAVEGQHFTGPSQIP